MITLQVSLKTFFFYSKLYLEITQSYDDLQKYTMHPSPPPGTVERRRQVVGGGGGALAGIIMTLFRSRTCMVAFTVQDGVVPSSKLGGQGE